MNAFKPLLYALAALTCLACTALLLRRYAQTRAPLLLWSTLCFLGLSVSNLLLVVDLALVPGVDLRLYRHLASLGGMLLLLYGFIWETDS